MPGESQTAGIDWSAVLATIIGAGLMAIGWFGNRWWTRHERLIQNYRDVKDAGLPVTVEEEQVAAEAKRRLLRGKVEPSILQAAKMMDAAIALVASVKAETKQPNGPDLKEVQRLVEMLLNQVVSARFEARWHFEWIRQLDMQLHSGSEDARYYLMAAMNDAELLRTLTFMRLIGAPLIESDQKEITAFEESVDLNRLAQKYDEVASLIPGVTEQHRKDFHDKLTYIRNAGRT